MVHRDLARAVGGANKYVSGRPEMRRSGSLDRLGLSLAVWSAQANRQLLLFDF